MTAIKKQIRRKLLESCVHYVVCVNTIFCVNMTFSHFLNLKIKECINRKQSTKYHFSHAFCVCVPNNTTELNDPASNKHIIHLIVYYMIKVNITQIMFLLNTVIHTIKQIQPSIFKHCKHQNHNYTYITVIYI